MRQAGLNIVERARKIFEGQSREGTAKTREDGRLTALDINFHERRNAERLDQVVECGHLDLDFTIPPYASEIGILGAGIAPSGRERRDRGRALAE